MESELNKYWVKTYPTLNFLKIDEKAVIPRKAYKGDACFDISILVDEGRNKPVCLTNENILFPVKMREDGCNGVTIGPNQSVVLHTGLKCEFSEGYVLKIYPRSSTGIKKGFQLSNGTGIIDAGYRGEIMIALTNTTNEFREICSGDRVAQGELCEVLEFVIQEVTELSETCRGEKGIGSSGEK